MFRSEGTARAFESEPQEGMNEDEIAKLREKTKARLSELTKLAVNPNSIPEEERLRSLAGAFEMYTSPAFTYKVSQERMDHTDPDYDWAMCRNNKINMPLLYLSTLQDQPSISEEERKFIGGSVKKINEIVVGGSNKLRTEEDMNLIYSTLAESADIAKRASETVKKSHRAAA